MIILPPLILAAAIVFSSLLIPPLGICEPPATAEAARPAPGLERPGSSPALTMFRLRYEAIVRRPSPAPPTGFCEACIMHCADPGKDYGQCLSPCARACGFDLDSVPALAGNK